VDIEQVQTPPVGILTGQMGGKTEGKPNTAEQCQSTSKGDLWW